MRKYRVNTVDGIIKVFSDAVMVTEKGSLKFVKDLRIIAEFPEGAWTSYMEESLEKGGKEVE